MARGIKGTNHLMTRNNCYIKTRQYGCPKGTPKCRKRNSQSAVELTLKQKWGTEYRCGLCIYTSPNILHMRHHIELHAIENAYDCPDCNDSFPVLSLLRRHRRVMHVNEKAFICKICNKDFKRPETLRVHKKLHDRNKTLACKTCKKVFKDSLNLRAHERLHNICKPYPCVICGKGFIYKANFERHVLKHSVD